MKEIVNLLGHDGLKVVQDSDLFSLSTDSILLASFVNITRNTKNIVDLCSGSAVIPMYLSLRTKENITGVEIEKTYYDLALESLEINGLTNQIKMINADAKDISNLLGFQKYDLVTCNPPYFEFKEQSLTNKSDIKTIARHEVLIKLDDVIREASRLLNNNGHFALVHRPERLVEIIVLLEKYHLVAKRIQFVYPKPNENAVCVLIDAAKTNKLTGLKVLPELYIYNENNEFTDIVKNIYNNGGI